MFVDVLVISLVVYIIYRRFFENKEGKHDK